jgi:divalent metal cation (Fe/Co/Zn/Cd) transporter
MSSFFNRLLLEGSANLLVLMTKVAVGVSTGSLAVLGDAMNNIVTWVVIRLSSVPADREHPYGHRKFETLAVFRLAAVLVILGFGLALQAVRREATDVVSGAWEFGLMLGVLGVNGVWPLQ